MHLDANKTWLHVHITRPALHGNLGTATWLAVVQVIKKTTQSSSQLTAPGPQQNSGLRNMR